ncbi:MAG TPA: phospholipase D family protein, partial [Bacteroidetes bacterium]|nr:phospholipase D family protein [Bacteroidota bacterium]
LAGAGISVFIDHVHAIAHNKVMIIDNESIITGSFNFSKAAEERNAENILIIQNKQLAAKFLENWRIHQRHSTLYSQPRAPK